MPEHGCAIGCCLPQELRDMEVLGSISNILEGLEGEEARKAFQDYFRDNDLEFLIAMQAWHDNNSCELHQLREIAADFELEMSVAAHGMSDEPGVVQ